MIKRLPRFGIRTLFLVTTLAALVVYAFTLGTLEGYSTLFLFTLLYYSKTKKERVFVASILVLTLIVIGTISRYDMRGSSISAYSRQSCVSIFFTGGDQGQQGNVRLLVNSKMPNKICYSGSAIVPFFRSGFLQLNVDEEDLQAAEDEVRRLIEESFPDLSVEIESHSALEETE